MTTPSTWPALSPSEAGAPPVLLPSVERLAPGTAGFGARGGEEGAGICGGGAEGWGLAGGGGDSEQ